MTTEQLLAEATPRPWSLTDYERLLRVEASARAARFVADFWRGSVMASEELRRTGMSHPLAMVLAAFDGETDPRMLGLPEEADKAFRAALSEDEPTAAGGGR